MLVSLGVGGRIRHSVEVDAPDLRVIESHGL